MAEQGNAAVRPGDVLAGKYEVERVLGAGGMGVVVAAHHRELGTRVALKFMLPELAASPTAVERFLREAKAVSRLRGEHVARVSDVGKLESGSPYIVMEYLEGSDLDGVLETQGPLAPMAAVDIVLQACTAMAEAHAQGVIHRDLKPGNLFLARRPDGRPIVKVLDFGISKIATPDEESHQMTRTGAIIGSPSYMAPEQMKSSKHVDPRADVWSLGVILYRLMTNKLPFIAETLAELMATILSEQPRSLRELAPAVPEGLELVVMSCLEKDKNLRVQSVGELAELLAPFAGEEGRSAAQQTMRMVPPPPPGARASRASAAQARMAHGAITGPTAPGGVGRGPITGPHAPAAFGGRSGGAVGATSGSLGEVVVPAAVPPPRSRATAFAILGVALATGAVAAAFLVRSSAPSSPAVPETSHSSIAAPPPEVAPVATVTTAPSATAPPASAEPPVTALPQGARPARPKATPAPVPSAHPTAQPTAKPKPPEDPFGTVQ